MVENPRRLDERFALVAPGQANPPTSVTIHVASEESFQSFRLPSGTPVSVDIIPESERNAGGRGHPRPGHHGPALRRV